MSRILVSGSIAYDVLFGFEGSFLDTLKPDALEALSVAFVSPRRVRQYGGTGVNVAWGIRALGKDPLLVGAVGSDGGEYLRLLERKRIATDYIEQIEDQVTATAIITTDSQERQITFFHPGADAHAAWPSSALEQEDISLAIASPRDPLAVQAGIAWCNARKIPVFFDPGQGIGGFGKEELRRLTAASAGVVANEYEWAVLKDATGHDENTIAELTPLAIITRGERGLTYISREGSGEVPACRAERVVNPTGAGDALRAGLLTGLLAGWPLQDACQLGCAMGSFAVEIDGTLIRASRDAIFKRAEMAYGESLPKEHVVR